MKIEQFAPRDIPALTAHSKTVGWYEPADWEDFIATGEVFGHRLESGQIVSSAYRARYGAALSWLGAFIVNPRFQGKGLGKSLIGECVGPALPGNAVLGLVATEEGEPLYRKAGFRAIGTTLKLVTEAGFKLADDAASSAIAIRAAAPETDRESILRLDREAVGADRAKLLETRMKGAVKNLVALDRNGEVVGFIFGALDSRRLILGPLVSPDAISALALIAGLSRHWNGCMRIDIPDWQRELVQALLARGFRQERVCPVMTLRGNPLPATSPRYFALVGQAFG